MDVPQRSMSNKRSTSKYIKGLAVAFLLPLSFYVLAKVLRKDQLSMPAYFIAEKVDSSVIDGKKVYDTTFHQVGELQGTNQFGDAVALNKDLQGKILLVDFIFTTCPTICPQLTRNMKMLVKAYRRTPMANNDTIVQFISITVDPERDSAGALFAYAKRNGVDMNHWWFLTGDKKTLYNYARNELHLATPDGNGGADDFIHSQQFVLIDRNRHIRGYYDGLDSQSIGRCAFDIGRLNMERGRKRGENR